MKVGRLFDDWARRGRGEGMEAGHKRTALPALAALRVGPGDRLLDLGTGNGWALRHAASLGAEAVGVDLSRQMLARAGKDVVQADFVHLPFGDDSFTALWSMEALYYAPDPAAVLREAARVLRPGAQLHVLVDFYEENKHTHTWPQEVGVPMALLSQDTWRQAATDAGFTATTTRLRSPLPEDAGTWKADEGTLYLSGTL